MQSFGRAGYVLGADLLFLNQGSAPRSNPANASLTTMRHHGCPLQNSDKQATPIFSLSSEIFRAC